MMSTYIKLWDCCGDTTETESWEPERCPFCEADENVWLRRRVAELEAKSDGGAVPVATVKTWNAGGSGEFTTAEGIEKLPDGTKLYTAPQQPVRPDGGAACTLRPLPSGDVDGGLVCTTCGDVFSGPSVNCRRLGRRPQQPAQGQWVKCSETLPAKEDVDCDGKIWSGYYDPITRRVGEVYRNSINELLIHAERCPESLYWMPTGLKRPTPPAGSGE